MEKRHVRWERFLVAAIVSAAVAGCGWRNDGRYQVTGSVFFDGQPLDHGDITFKPADRSQGAVGGQIKAGAFALRCPPGAARVEINASRIVPRKAGAGGTGGLPDDPRDSVVEFIPRRSNAESVLEATIEPHHRNVADFRLDAE